MGLSGRDWGELGPRSTANVDCLVWGQWAFCGRTLRIGTDPDTAKTCAEAVVTARWRKCGKQRAVLHGLGDGRHEEVMHLVNRASSSRAAKGMPWSSSRTASTILRGPASGGDTMLGARYMEQHFIDGNGRPPEQNIAPPALRYSGKVLRHRVEPTNSLEMQLYSTEAHRDWDTMGQARCRHR